MLNGLKTEQRSLSYSGFYVFWSQTSQPPEFWQISITLELFFGAKLWVFYRRGVQQEARLLFLECSCNYLRASLSHDYGGKTNPGELRLKRTPAEMQGTTRTHPRALQYAYTHTHTQSDRVPQRHARTYTLKLKPRGPQFNWTFPPIHRLFFPPLPSLLISRELEVAEREAAKQRTIKV